MAWSTHRRALPGSPAPRLPGSPRPGSAGYEALGAADSLTEPDGAPGSGRHTSDQEPHFALRVWAPGASQKHCGNLTQDPLCLCVWAARNCFQAPCRVNFVNLFFEPHTTGRLVSDSQFIQNAVMNRKRPQLPVTKPLEASQSPNLLVSACLDRYFTLCLVWANATQQSAPRKQYVGALLSNAPRALDEKTTQNSAVR